MSYMGATREVMTIISVMYDDVWFIQVIANSGRSRINYAIFKLSHFIDTKKCQ